MRGSALLTGAAILAALIAGCSQAPKHPLVGQKAPDFTGTMLDGAPFALAEHIGQDVLILDFWATWCPPCREGLPILSEVAATYRDRGVRLFAIDVEEDADTVREFLKGAGLELSVVLDPDGTINKKYLVDGIPQTVIIGKDGRVAAVHVGLARDTRQRLTEEIDTLLSGGKLAAR